MSKPTPIAEFEAAQIALRRHLASWAYAYAHAGGCHGGAEHPAHRATRARTAALRARVHATRATLHSEPVQEAPTA